MSRSFTTLFASWIKHVFIKDPRYEMKSKELTIITGFFFTICGLTHGVYAFGTSKPENSKIVKKYKMVRNGFTEFMVIDEQGKHYNINNSFWYWKWNSIEDWSNIKEGNELYFRYYGWRVPALGLFPNIYMTNHVQILDSISRTEIRLFKHEQGNKKLN